MDDNEKYKDYLCLNIGSKYPMLLLSLQMYYRFNRRFSLFFCG